MKDSGTGNTKQKHKTLKHFELAPKLQLGIFPTISTPLKEAPYCENGSIWPALIKRELQEADDAVPDGGVESWAAP